MITVQNAIISKEQVLAIVAGYFMDLSFKLLPPCYNTAIPGVKIDNQ